MSDELVGDSYEIIEEIGRGSFGVVYKATNKTSGQLVALKKVFLETNRGVATHARREVMILNQLSHPNIISLLEILEDDECLYMEFELFPMDLDAMLSSYTPCRNLKPELIRSYLFQIADGINYCHSHQVMHRDLKPRNLLVNKEGVLKVADFGLAMWIGKPSILRSRWNTSHRVGTLLYRAPEMLLGSRNYKQHIDIWAIGCIFAEMTTNVVLFEGNSEFTQLLEIFDVLGTPTEETWPGVSSLRYFKLTTPANQPCSSASQPSSSTEHSSSSTNQSSLSANQLADKVKDLNPAGLDLLNKMLTYDPEQRISASEILKHAYFGDFDHQLVRPDADDDD